MFGPERFPRYYKKEIQDPRGRILFTAPYNISSVSVFENSKCVKIAFL